MAFSMSSLRLKSVYEDVTDIVLNKGLIFRNTNNSDEAEASISVEGHLQSHWC